MGWTCSFVFDLSLLHGFKQSFKTLVGFGTLRKSIPIWLLMNLRKCKHREVKIGKIEQEMGKKGSTCLKQSKKDGTMKASLAYLGLSPTFPFTRVGVDQYEVSTSLRKIIEDGDFHPHQASV